MTPSVPTARRNKALVSSFGLGEKLFASSDERRFAVAIEAGLESVEAGLLAELAFTDDLADVTSRYLLEAGGKRVRPVLTLLTAQLGSGNNDAVIGASGNWIATTWTINPVLVGVTAEGAYVDPDLIGEWQLHQRHANVVCNATPTLLQATRSGNNNVDTWLDCSGSLKVQRVYTADHKISSLQTAAGFSLFDAAADFIDSQN